MHSPQPYVPPLLAPEPPLVLAYLRAALESAGALIVPTHERDTLAWRGRDGALVWVRFGYPVDLPPGYRSLDVGLLPRPRGLPPGPAHAAQRQERAPRKVWSRPKYCRQCVAAIVDLVGYLPRRAA